MSQQRVIEVMADVCAALDFSHKHSIIHRDVKPANIMINRAGAVKVMDFGIARALGEGQNVTQTAAVIGTAQYLSPEQARGEAVDARSDVYAAGCVLFELLTGEPPFTGDTPVAVAYQHVREDPRSPSELNPQVTPQLDAIVLKALSKNPANRYQSSAEMRADLVRVRSGQQPLAPVVMSEDERTALLNPRSTGQTRRINGAGATRYAPPPPPPRPLRRVRRLRRRPGPPAGAAGSRSASRPRWWSALLALTGYLIFGGSPARRQVAVPNVVGPAAGGGPRRAAGGEPAGHVAAGRLDGRREGPGRRDRPGRGHAGRRAQHRRRCRSATGRTRPPFRRWPGRTVAEAGPLLTERGLVLGAQTEQNTADAAQVGKIISSTPAAGENVPGRHRRGRRRREAADHGRRAGRRRARTPTTRSASWRRPASRCGARASTAATRARSRARTRPRAPRRRRSSTVTLRVFTGDSNSVDMPDVAGRPARAGPGHAGQRRASPTSAVQREPRTTRARSDACSTSRRRRAAARRPTSRSCSSSGSSPAAARSRVGDQRERRR